MSRPIRLHHAAVARLAAAPAVARRGALHRDRDDEAQAARRPAALPRRHRGWRSRSPRSTSRAATRNTDLWLVPLAGGEPRRLTANPASDTRPRFSPDGKSLAFLSTRDGSSQVWQLELARRRAAQAHVARDRRRRVRVARAGAARARERGLPRVRRGRRLQRRSGSRGRQGPRARASTTSCSSATGTPGSDGRRSHLLVAAARRRHGAWTSRRATTTCRPSTSAARTGRSRPTAARSASRASDAKRRGLEHERRPVRGPDRGRRARSASRTRPATTAAAATAPTARLHRLPRAAARGLRVRPLAADGLRPRERRARATLTEAFDRQVDERVCSPDSQDALLHGRGRRPRAGVLGAGRGRRRHAACWAAPGRSATSRSRATAARSSPRRRRSRTRPRSSASASDGRRLARVTHVNDALLRRLRAARRARA